MPKKIAFIKVRSFSFINPSLIEQFERTFGDYEIEIFDLKDWVKAHKALILLSYGAVVREYGADLVRRKKNIHQFLFSTSYMFKQIKRAVAARINPRDYAFTFQTQSLFDASVPGVPHFMYTDYTVKANLRNPQVDLRRVMFSPEWSRLEPAIYANPRKIFAASNVARDSMIADYGCDPDQVKCVYTGVNVKIEPPADKDYRGRHVLFVGVEWERKGGPELLAAFKRALAVCPDARLTIVGCSPEVDSPNVTVVGRIPKEQVAQYFQQASIFAMPSRIEPAGIAFTEAAMYKLPIISANSGGIPDRVIHNQTGYLAEVGDVAALERYLIDLLTNPDRCREFGEAGERLAREHFTWERVGDVIHAEITAAIGA